MPPPSPNPHLPPPPPNYGSSLPTQNKGNGIAIAGLILAFFIPLLGLIFSLIGLKQSKKIGGAGRGIALAGLIISSLSILVTIGLIILIFLAAPALQRNARDSRRLGDVGLVRASIETVASDRAPFGAITQETLIAELEVKAGEETSIFSGFDIYSSGISNDLGDTSSSIYVLQEDDLTAVGEKLPSTRTLYVILGATCSEDMFKTGDAGDTADNGDNADASEDASESIGSRQAAIIYTLEDPGSSGSEIDLGNNARCSDRS